MYDHKPSEAYCKQIGIKFSYEDFKEFAGRSINYEFTQEQVDFSMREHAFRIKFFFTPKNYSYLNRIKLALHFLNPFSKGI